MRQVILDMDPGIDDAAAIAVAVNHPDLNVSLITTVAGNVSVDKTTNSALKLLEFFHREDIPVAAGASKPLKKAFADAANIHGESGMPGYDFPESTIKPIEDDAVTAMHDVNTILYAVDPSCMTVKDGAIDVVTEGPAAGATVWDFQQRWHTNDFVNASIGVDVDAERFNEWFLAQVQQMNA